MRSRYRRLAFTVCACALLAEGWSDPAAAADPPADCFPTCRKGYTCRQGKCVSLCNPPCPTGERCVGGECEPASSGRKKRAAATGAYLALLGGYSAALSNSATGTGALRAEFGGRNAALQLGPSFGSNSTAIRGAIVGNVPIRILKKIPLYVVPMVQLGYAFNWVDDALDTRQQDFFITPGARLRYDITRRLALLLDLVQIEITFLRLQSDRVADYSRVDSVPVHWGTHAGLAVLY